jgi:phospholipase/carboxylesterase
MTSLTAVTSPQWPAAHTSDHAPVLILLHGYGSHEHDLAGLAPLLPTDMPWASLRAPLAMDFGGAAWFPLDFGEEAPVDQVKGSTEAIWAWIDAHVPADAPIVVVGFSQGGFMALQLLRTRPERIAATVVLAGFTTTGPRPADEEVASMRPTVFWGRGDADQVVPAAMIEQTQEWMAAHVDADEQVYTGLAHGIHEQMMADVRSYISVQLHTDHS